MGAYNFVRPRLETALRPPPGDAAATQARQVLSSK